MGSPPSRFPQRLLAAALCLLALVLGAPRAARGATLPGPGAPLRVVLDDDYPPFIFRAPDGSLKGILVDQWALWAKRTGIPVQLDAMPWGEAQRHMAAGGYDVIDTMFETPQRRVLYHFGPPYARIDVPIFFARELSGISGPRDLTGFIVGVKDGDNSVDVLRAQGVGHFAFHRNYEDLVAAARDGKLKVFTVDRPPALYYLIKMGIQDQFRESGPLYSGEFHRAVRKGRADLLAKVQEGFTAIGRAEYDAIDRRWRGVPLLSRDDLRRTALVSGVVLALLGLLLGWVWSLRRMVARRTAELRAISRHFTNGMFYQMRIGPDGRRRFTYLSESVPRLYGVPAAAALADPDLLYRRVHPDDLGPLAAAEDEAIRTLTTFRAEARVVDPDGSVRWSSFVSTPTPMPDGSSLWDGVEFIITDRKRSEEALRASEARVRSLVSAIPDLLFTFGRDGTYQTAHASNPDLLLFPTENLLGRTVREVLPEPLAGRFLGVIRETLDGGGVHELDYSLDLEGEERFFSARVAKAGQDRVIALVRDVTRSRRLEEQQRLLQAQLLQAQKLDSLGSLAGGVAHDMNNVLGAILAIASYNLEVQPPDSALHRAFDTIAKAAARGGQMVRNLLNFARQAPDRTQAVDLNGLLRDVIQLLERTTLAKVRLETDLEEGLGPVLGDPGALANAFMNLAVNGVDAMGGGGTLRLRTRNLADGWVEALVEDTGAGMGPEVLQKAMDPYFTTKETGKGTGLGLAMVYGTVKAHGGRMEIRSEPGQGTRVALRFPGAAPRAGATAPEAADDAPPAVPRRSLAVLLVDDDPDVNESLCGLLDLLGHRAESVPCGEDALARLDQGYRPDAVFLDLNMPGLGGRGTLPRLRQRQPEIPVVLVTGKADQAAQDLTQAYRRVTLLPKPFSLEELRRHLDRL